MDHSKEYAKALKGMDALAIVQWTIETFGVARIALASSFSIEDQVLTHMLLQANPKSRVFTLDTGRHFNETYEVWQKSVDVFHVNYEVCFPDSAEVSDLVSSTGPNLFYKSVETRKSCCAVRKTHPLDKKLSTVDAWIVGLRSEQAITRTTLEPVEWDDAHKIYRISPLYNWNEQQTLSYVKEHDLPVSSLYEKGFRSIGCAPCTRAIELNDNVRAGRWWWEEPEHKECGLHNRNKGK